MAKDLQQCVRCTMLPAGASRGEAIRTMACLLFDVVPVAAVIDSAMTREAEGSTYLGHGLAVPHARLDGLETPLVTLATCAGGVDWNGERATLIALLVVPDKQPELHLALLATLARALSVSRKQGVPLALPELAEQLGHIVAPKTV